MRVIKINFDKFFNILVFIFAFTLIITQVFLTLTKFDRYYKDLASKGYIYTSAKPFEEETVELRLTIHGNVNGESIYVLQNGDEVACFNESTIYVVITNNSVVEIDGRANKGQFYVTVSYNKEQKIQDLPEKIEVNSNIAMLGRVLIE